MEKIRLGKTELMVTKTGMGCLPVQRCDVDTAVKILRAAYEGGINFFDTANAYTDSEHKIGLALSDVRDQIVIATKSGAWSREGVLAHVENSLKELKTDHIDLLQLHNIPQVPDPEDPEGPYAGAMEAKRRGWINHIGATAHRLFVAEEAIESGLFETLQFPFSYISDERDLALAEKCRAADMGYIAMKGLAGGLLKNARVCQAFMNQYDNVVPIWGVQRMEELEQWLTLAEEKVTLDEEMKAFIQQERKELAGTFCRSCGYCMPCTVGINIRQAARMNMLLRRSPWQQFMSDKWYEEMHKINDCVECGLCRQRCPYGLDTPKVLKEMLADYEQFYESHKNLL